MGFKIPSVTAVGTQLSQPFIMSREVQLLHAHIICVQGTERSVTPLPVDKSNLLNEREVFFPQEHKSTLIYLLSI